VGSRAITTPHHLTTVPLARLGTDEVGGGLFLAVCEESRRWRTSRRGGRGAGGAPFVAEKRSYPRQRQEESMLDAEAPRVARAAPRSLGCLKQRTNSNELHPTMSRLYQCPAPRRESI